MNLDNRVWTPSGVIYAIAAVKLTNCASFSADLRKYRLGSCVLLYGRISIWLDFPRACVLSVYFRTFFFDLVQVRHSDKDGWGERSNPVGDMCALIIITPAFLF